MKSSKDPAHGCPRAYKRFTTGCHRKLWTVQARYKRNYDFVSPSAMVNYERDPRGAKNHRKQWSSRAHDPNFDDSRLNAAILISFVEYDSFTFIRFIFFCNTPILWNIIEEIKKVVVKKWNSQWPLCYINHTKK